MSKIILHVGAGKTGSSALQKYLSLRTEPLIGGDVHYEYCAVEPDGSILRQEQVRSKAVRTAMRSLSSARDLSTVDASRFADGLRQLEQARIIPIFSQERWLKEPTRSNDLTCLEAATAIEIVAYLRPQAEWFNSGWWQWWAWDSRVRKPEDALDLWPENLMHWGHFLRLWSKVPNVTIRARLAKRDIVGDFLGLLAIPAEHQVEIVNQSMSERLIRLYRAVPGFRQRAGGELDAILSRYMKNAGKTPWILTPEMIERIIAETKETNELLLSFLDAAQQDEMRADPRWWDPSAFADRVPVPLDELQMDSQEAAQFLAQVLMHVGRPRP